MKRFFLKVILGIVLLSIVPSQAIAFDFYFNGINLKWLKDAKPKDYIVMILGASSNLFIHELGHIGYKEINNLEYDIKINHYSISTIGHNGTNKQIKRSAMSGYILDSSIGLLLTSFEVTRNSYFTKGYTLSNSIGLATYNMRNKKVNDFNTIKNNGGNEDLFFWTITGVSAHNLLRQEW